MHVVLNNVYVEGAWGKADLASSSFHHLAHHSADVAAVFKEILAQRVFRDRAQNALGRALSELELDSLSALVFLHDIGKLAPGFQSKAWKSGRLDLASNHLECGWAWASLAKPSSLGGAGADLLRWKDLESWFWVLMAHHGRPAGPPKLGAAEQAFRILDSYDWRTAEDEMGRAFRSWFPAVATGTLPEPKPEFLHFICGLITLADWIGSDRRAFPFEASFRETYWDTARALAVERVRQIGLGTSPRLRGTAGWDLVSDHPVPRPAQAAIGRVPPHEHLVLLEAETGAGKTEAAIWRFVALLAAGEVDALYFAVPTRAAARQLHRRVNQSLSRMFDDPPEAVLAIPGQAVAGEARGQRLPDFSMLWDDGETKSGRWAAEHAARYLAARIAVGTVDQVALGGLQVKHAHLRASALSRALLVVDEVHASDPYMIEVQNTLVSAHLELGGHVLLMSATLGAAARRIWRGEKAGDFAHDASLPYPAIWTSTGLLPIDPDPDASKTVEVQALNGWSAAAAADLATKAAHDGARVLVIRNTVNTAQETFAACPDRHLLLEVNGFPTLHHSRFAAEDRARLDRAVEAMIGKDSPLGGRIVIGTQTLEQSLDLCADLLITDLCPMDVLLQRIGRLHRHRRARPTGYQVARVLVLCPQGGLDPLTKASENGLGAFAGGASLSGVYVNVPSLAATLEQIVDHPVWTIPSMNRRLVEAATHPQALERIAVDRGWQTYWQRVTGKSFAERNLAQLGILDRHAPLSLFPDDVALRTRLGEEGVVLRLPDGTVGPFGEKVTRLALPAHWSHGIAEDAQVTVSENRVTVSDMSLSYGPEGLSRL